MHFILIYKYPPTYPIIVISTLYFFIYYNLSYRPSNLENY